MKHTHFPVLIIHTTISLAPSLVIVNEVLTVIFPEESAGKDKNGYLQ